jgi:hypothetical protein
MEIDKVQLLIVMLAFLWTIPWKICSIWTAIKMDHKRWFVALIILNTFGILDIFYVFYVAKKTPGELVEIFKTKI